MQVHDLQRLRVPATAPAHQGSAIVRELREQSIVLSEEPGGEPWSARRAASCLLAPELGDRVWFVVEAGVPGQQRCFVTAVLERESDAAARLGVAGAPELRVEAARLTLRADAQLELQADELRARGRLARVVLDECSSVLRTLFTHASKVTVVGKVVETLADRISQHSKISQRTVEQIDQVKAGTIDYRATCSAQIGAEHALVTGAELVKIDGGQIHLG
ncbi:DUF3540 domain-containing protein [Nannocystis radixulma]|uniref:DUF3540 domain-containing protein n=1 Tax=Nannocystis radixulma TaxID=2995305 RepID=A0ABT5BM63_9BACT|nr:DUF3540 domain-containing protein [Nannocystis radixulma]MDC0674498.1 DUF3540 domain-containing protein [Nannocystis radixulma]